MHGRPPEHYILVPGTTACLIENEYDKNIYGECNYVGNRTLIKCKQVRAIEQLGKNNGHCEIHDTFRKLLKRRNAKEDFRIACENKRRKFSFSNRTKDMVCDDDLFLQPLSKARWKQTGDKVHRFSLLDDGSFPFGGGFATTKEMLRLQIRLLIKERDFLIHYRTLKQANAADTACRYLGLKSENKPSKPVIMDDFNRRYLKAAKVYGHNSCRPQYMASDCSQVARCCFKTNEHDCCEKKALPKTQFCLLHISHDVKRIHITKCRKCPTVAVTEEKLCAFHALQIVEEKPVKFIEFEVSDDEFTYGTQLHPRIELKRSSAIPTPFPTSYAKKKPPVAKHLPMDGAARCRPFVSNKDHSGAEQKTTLTSQTITKAIPSGYHIPRATNNKPQFPVQYTSPLSSTARPIELPNLVVRRTSQAVAQAEVVRQSNSEHAAQRRRQIEEDQKAAASIQEDIDDPNTSVGYVDTYRPLPIVQPKRYYTNPALHRRQDESNQISLTPHRPVASGSNVVYNSPLTATQTRTGQYTIKANGSNAVYMATTVTPSQRIASNISTNGGYLSSNPANFSRLSDDTSDLRNVNSGIKISPMGNMSRAFTHMTRNDVPTSSVSTIGASANSNDASGRTVISSADRRFAIARGSIQRGHFARVPNVVPSSTQQTVSKNGIHPIRRAPVAYPTLHRSGNGSHQIRVVPSYQVQAQSQRTLQSTNTPAHTVVEKFANRTFHLQRLPTDRTQWESPAYRLPASESLSKLPQFERSLQNLNRIAPYAAEPTPSQGKNEDVSDQSISVAGKSLCETTSVAQPSTISQDPLSMLAEQALLGPSSTIVESDSNEDFDQEL